MFIAAASKRASVFGGQGDDTVSGNGTTFDIDGGQGNDHLQFEGFRAAGNIFQIFGGGGDDTITFTANPICNIQIRFIFESGRANDTVPGFVDGVDVTYLDAE